MKCSNCTSLGSQLSNARFIESFGQKFSNLSKEIGIHISNGFPIKMVYNLDDWKDKAN